MILEPPDDDVYLEWLYAQVTTPRQRRSTARSYWQLIRQLHTKEFIWFIPNDDNRVEDGRDIRREFVAQHPDEVFDNEWLEMGCSVLEMLIGLSRRLSFESDGEPRGWFWKLLENLRLHQANDQFPYDPNEVEEVLDRLIYRLYEPNGVGGLFPLDYAEQDQTEVEIWYQLNAYLLENE